MNLHTRRTVVLRVVLRIMCLGATLALASCGKHEKTADAPPAAESSATPAAALNSTDPRWVSQGTTRAKVAVVFVHGLTGDTLGTWTHASGTSFFSLLKQAPEVGPQVDVFAFGFTSKMFAGGSLDIREAANKLHESLQFNGVLDYPGIVFVAHSMGGLVSLRYLVNHRDLLPKVPLLVLFATPQEGAQIAAIGQHVLNNPALRQMLPADGNDFLKTLSDDWGLLPARPKVVCGYEKLPTAGVTIVPWSSATRFCDGAPAAIADADHSSIVKPDRPQHDAVVLLANALKTQVLNQLLQAELRTPDFLPEGDHLAFALTDPNGRASARLVNAGRAPLRFTLAQASDPHLYLWPDDTPRQLPGEQTERLSLALGFGASAQDYSFVIQTDAGPDQRVVVKVPNLAALRVQRARFQEMALQAIDTQLSDPQRARELAALPPGDSRPATEAVRAVQQAIARDSPGLPASAQWVMASEVLAASNWPRMAAQALRQAETVSPSVAQSPAAQRLAAQIAAGTGDARVFSQVSTPAAAVLRAPVLSPSTQQLQTAEQLATHLQGIPALRAYGLSLQGDVHNARGDKAAARSAFSQAVDLQANPSLKTRLQSTVSGSPSPDDPRTQVSPVLAERVTKPARKLPGAATERVTRP